MATGWSGRDLRVLYLLLLITLGFLSLQAECRRKKKMLQEVKHFSTNCRRHTASLTDFGGIGDGITSNTKIFQKAINHLSQFQNDGGSQLFVPPGKWLTGSFNLTSHFTLYLHRGATILASQDESEWPIVNFLPSYGRGRDAPGGRYSSLISGSNLTDVVITGDNGTIDGQGQIWWDKFHGKRLEYTRGYLIELIFSESVLISNLVLVNSPSWNIHPVYSRYVIVEGITILAPVNSPNTDGINPDSCSHVRIENCYIVSGDDCIAIKSGWDQYGISFGMPSQHILIRNLTCISPTSAVIALGSEMSGGIQDVRVENVVAINTESGVRIKTAIGRGSYIKDVFVRAMVMKTMKMVFWMTGDYGSHPDDQFDKNAIPVIEGISYSDMIAENVTTAGRLEGILGSPFTGICISNVTISVIPSKKPAWTCKEIDGVITSVVPLPCSSLRDQGSEMDPCPFPLDKLPIDEVELEECSYKVSISGTIL